MCGYIIDNSEDPDNKNFCDDDEIGGGRALLELLERNNITHRALFVIRYFGDNKIGQDRFVCIRNAAVSAIEKSPQNPYTGTTQEIILVQPKPVQGRSNIRQLHSTTQTRIRGRGNLSRNNNGRLPMSNTSSGRGYSQSYRRKAGYMTRNRGARYQNPRGNYYPDYTPQYSTVAANSYRFAAPIDAQRGRTQTAPNMISTSGN